MRRWAGGRLPLGARWQARQSTNPIVPTGRLMDTSSGSNVTLEAWSRVFGTTMARRESGQTRARAERTMRTLAVVRPETDGQDYFPQDVWRSLRLDEVSKSVNKRTKGQNESKEVLEQEPFWDVAMEEPSNRAIAMARVDSLAEKEFIKLGQAIRRFDREAICAIFSELDGSKFLQVEPNRLTEYLIGLDNLLKSMYELDDTCMSILGHYWRCLRVQSNDFIEARQWIFLTLIETLIRSGPNIQRSTDTARSILLFLESKDCGLGEEKLCSILRTISEIRGPAYTVNIVQRIIDLEKRRSICSLLTVSLESILSSDQPIFRPKLDRVMQEFKKHNLTMPPRAFDLLATQYVKLKDDMRLKELLDHMREARMEPTLTVIEALLQPDGLIRGSPQKLRATLASMQETNFMVNSKIANLILSALLEMNLIAEAQPLLEHFKGLDGSSLPHTLGFLQSGTTAHAVRNFALNRTVIQDLKDKASLFPSEYVIDEVWRRLDRIAQLAPYECVEQATSRIGTDSLLRGTDVPEQYDIPTMLRQVSYRVGHTDVRSFKEHQESFHQSALEECLTYINRNYKKKGLNTICKRISEAIAQSKFGSPIPFDVLPLQAYSWLVRLALQISSDHQFGLRVIEDLTSALDGSSYSRVFARCWAEVIRFFLQDSDRTSAVNTMEEARQHLRTRDHMDPSALVYIWLPLLRHFVDSRDSESFFEAWALMSDQIPELRLEAFEDGTVRLKETLDLIHDELAGPARPSPTSGKTRATLNKHPWTLWATLFKMLAQMKPAGNHTIIEMISTLDLLAFEPFDIKRLSWMFSDLLTAQAALGDVEAVFQSVNDFSTRLRQRQMSVLEQEQKSSVPKQAASSHHQKAVRPALPMIDHKALASIQNLLSAEVGSNRITASKASAWLSRIKKMQSRGL